MGGLAGIAARHGSLDATRATSQAEAMGRAQKHREPDGWQVVAHRGLVHVVGSTEGSRHDTAAGLSLAFDGKITNADALRDALRKTGTELRSDADHELVLRAWERWGPKCLDRLNGRFAFVLHDPNHGKSYLVRDRFGHKPFYYALTGDRIYFASEIKTLLAVLGPPELNELVLVEWSLYGDVLPPRTLFRGILALPVGHLLEIGAGGSPPESRAYYDVMDVVDRERYADYAARPTAEVMDILEATLDRVVHGHIEGQRGGVGVLLSGGVDSTVVAAMAARHADLKAYNFSAWQDSVLDERRMAVRVAEKLGLQLQTMTIDGGTYRRELARATWLFEMPLWHMQGVPIHLLARRAFEDGVRILLSGVSIGPLLGAASDRYRWILPPPFLSRIPAGLLRVARKAVYSANGLPIANPAFVRNLGFGLRLVDGGSRARVVERCDETYQFVESFRERRVHVMRMSDNALFLPRFFRQGDSLCMGESVEYCDAAVDSDYLALALNLHTGLIFRKKIPKWILKELATRYVPREVSFQKKHPVWTVPVDQFFSPMLRESLFRNGFLASHLGLDWPAVNALYQGEKEKSQILYRLVNIETWGRLFFMDQSVDEVSALLQ